MSELNGVKFPALRTPTDIDISISFPAHVTTRDTKVYHRLLDQTVSHAIVSLGWQKNPTDRDYEFTVTHPTADLPNLPASAAAYAATPVGLPESMELPVQLMPYSNTLLATKEVTGLSHIHTMNPLEIIGTKLALSLDPSLPKATHVTDIFNLMKANPPLFEMNEANRQAIRLVTITVLAQRASDGHHVYCTHLTPIPEHAAALKTRIDEREQFRGVQIKPEFALAQLSAIFGLTRSIFDVDDEGKLKLTPAEIQFIDQINQPTLQPAERNIRVDLLKQDYANVFAQHPELEVNLRQQQFLLDRIEEQAPSRPTGHAK